MALFGNKQAAAQPGGAAPAPAGSLFGLAGVTQPVDQPENNDQTTVTGSATAQTAASQLVPFKNTDVITSWELDLTVTNTFTAGTTTTTSGQHFPYNFLGPVKIQIQNMYPAIDVLSGIDLVLFELLHPTRRLDTRQYAGAGPAATWAGGTLEANGVSSVAATSGTASIKLSFVLPVSLVLDVYYDLANNGRMTMPQHRALVSPQWMSGISRSVLPAVTFNAGIGTTCDTSPYSVSGTTLGTWSGSYLSGWRRVGYYGNNVPGTQPPVYNWQSVRQSKQFTIGAATQFDFNIPPAAGQVLVAYIRLFDATSGTNAPIAISNVTKCQVKYGSGLFRFDDTPRTMQKRIYRQLGINLPIGVLAWCFGLDDWGRWNNALALNTYTTANPTIHIELSAQGSGAYGVLGLESLAYVEQ